MTTKKSELIEIRPITEAQVSIHVQGTSPLIMHAWSAKAKRQILEKELGFTVSKARDVKNPFEDFCSSMYWLTPMPEEFTAKTVSDALQTARFGFPVAAFKQAAIAAAFRMGWLKDKVSSRGAFFIVPTHNGYYGGDLQADFDRKALTIVPNVYKSEPMIEIHSDTPVMREDMVRVGLGAADIRYRGEFRNWSADFDIRYNMNGQYSIEQIANIINAGGFACGIGEWRPEKDGQYGMFKVVAKG